MEASSEVSTIRDIIMLDYSTKAQIWAYRVDMVL